MSPTKKSKKDSRNREDPSRAVFIQREINYSLFKEVLPQVVGLRVESTNPITVYLDSPGGDISFADLISNLVRCPNQDGRSCKMITVASGFVASSAADMLALGDYAIAYPFSQILYHGTRHFDEDHEITLEKIPGLAASLRANNEQYAFRLAARMFRRMVFHIIVNLKERIRPGDLIGPSELFNAKQIDGFLGILKERLKAQSSLLNNTATKQNKFKELVATLRAKDGHGGGIDASDQPGLFKHLLDVELSANPGKELIHLLPVVEDDYVQIRDFFFGRYVRNLTSIISNSGKTFLSPNESEQLKEVERKGKKEATMFLLNTVSPRLEPLWFFVVSLCRSLQEGEYPMTAEEAYWCGLVDEVVGTKLPCMRTEVNEASSNEQSPPSSQSQPGDLPSTLPP